MQLIKNIRQKFELQTTIFSQMCRLAGATAFANCSAMDAPNSAASAPDNVWFTARYFCKTNGQLTQRRNVDKSHLKCRLKLNRCSTQCQLQPTVGVPLELLENIISDFVVICQLQGDVGTL